MRARASGKQQHRTIRASNGSTRVKVSTFFTVFCTNEFLIDMKQTTVRFYLSMNDEEQD
jgi:hypothetical protein